MASFHSKTFEKHDDYMTPRYAWEYIKDFIPKDKVIWEAFYGDGQSGNDLREMGFEVIHEPIDFFSNDLGDIIVSNPPFSKSKQVIERLFNLDKPFIIILPVSKITTKYFKNAVKGKENDLKILIPHCRIHFKKIVNGEVVFGEEGSKSRCNFDCFFYCYKIDTIKNNITFL